MAEIRPVASLVIGVGGTGVQVATYILKDLLEISGTNDLPPGVAVLAFDTEATNRVKIGGWGRPRQQGGHRTGAVQLDNGQYAYVGGEVNELARKVAIGQYPYLSKWWNAQGYLNDNLAADLWNLNKGAGQYRQFGRLALFQNFSNPVTSMIRSAVQTIKRGAPGTELYIHVTGSFVGGTGAGMFVDIAHIAASIARQEQLSQISVRGYFALVDAFLGTPQVGLADPRKKATYQAQAYACLRECSRLLSATDWATGYPMYYADSGDDLLMRGKISKRPYDAVYLFDGHRVRNPLDNSLIEEGIAPTIADAVLAHVDSKSGNTFVAHTVNSDKQRTSLKIPADVPTYGTLGTFTFVLPIFHIVEEWTHRLAKETLDELLVPLKWSEDTGAPISPLANNKRGGMAVEAGATGKERAEEWLARSAPTRFIRDVGSIGDRHGKQNLQKEVEIDLRTRSIETWIGLLKPDDVMAQVVKDAIERATLVLETDLTKEKVKVGGQNEENEYYVNPSPGGSDRDQADHVSEDVRKMVTRLAGEEDTNTGKRSGGRVKVALDELKNTHVKKFRTDLRAILDRELNGSDASDPLEAKAGKVGYAIDYLTTVRDALRQALLAIEKTEGVQQSKGTAGKKQAGSRRQQAESALSEINDKMSKSGGWLGVNRKDYVKAGQAYLQVLKSEIAERVVHEAVSDLIGVADDALDGMMAWANTLAFRSTEKGGMYALVHEGRSSNAHDRQYAAKTKVREQITDEEYENKRYDEYVTRGGAAGRRTQLKEILKELNWAIRINENTGKVEIDLALGKIIFNPEMRKPLGDANANAFLDRCRSVFETAWTDLSILRYLIDEFGNEIPSLAKHIYDSSGPLLRVQGDDPLPANFLRIHFESVGQLSAASEREAANQQGFLSQLVSELATLNKVQVTRSASDQSGDTKFSSYADSGDRFKLSFVYFSELNQLKDVHAYSSAVTDYRSYLARQRTYLHLFPAEQHAVTMESQLGPMKPPQRPREFEDRVVVQLEDMERFKFITRCLVYGNGNQQWANEGGQGMLLYRVIQRGPDNPNSWPVYRLAVQPVGDKRAGGKLVDSMTGKPAVAKYWDLTELARDPSLLAAFNQFNYKKYAVNNPNDTIEDERVQVTLDLAMEMDWKKRKELGILNWGAPSGWPTDRVKDAEMRVAQYLKYQEVMEVWQRELQRTYRGAITPSEALPDIEPEVQREADLRTAMILVLLDEISALKGQIADYGGEWSEVVAVAEPVQGVAAEPISPVAPMQDKVKCPNCGKLVAPEKFCSECGKPLPPPTQTLNCSNCGKELAADVKFCANCGTPRS